MNDTRERIIDNLFIVWVIAVKDIVDVLKNRMIVSLILMSSLMMLLPKMLPLIFEQPATNLAVYEASEGRLVAELEQDSRFDLQKVSSTQEFGNILCNTLYPELGLVVPANFDQALEGIEQPGDLQLPDLEGYLCWGKRFEAGALRSKLEGQISQLLGRPVHIAIEGNIVYPPSESGLSVGLVMLNSVVLILMIGIALVPHLLFEEKQTKTLEALLVSPASIGQVVAGKALAGFFYILVTGGIMLAINWADIVHWDVVILFVMGGGLFAVAVGLLLGSFFSNPQDTTGWVGVLLLVFIGTIFVKMLGVELPAVFRVILPWVPSVALAEVCRAAFSESVSLSRLMSNLGIVLAISLPLYGLVVWKVHRSDQ